MASVQRSAFFVEKGGVGKTTSAAHTAVAAAQDHGHDVLLVDLAGTQNDLATQFGLEVSPDAIDAPISAVFGDDWSFIRDNIDDIVSRMVFETGEGPDLIPADPGLGGADNNLANVPVEERYSKLDDFVEDELASEYDLVVFDLPGKEDNIALNGLFAASDVVTPLKPGAFERHQLANLQRNLAEIRQEHEGVNPEIAMVVPTMIDLRQSLHEDFVADVQEELPELAAPTVVKQSANISNQQDQGRTLFALEDDQLYQSGLQARNAYSEITDELLHRLEAR